MIALLDIFPLGITGIPSARRALVSSYVDNTIQPIQTDVSVDGDCRYYEFPQQHFLGVNRGMNQLKRQLNALEIFPSIFLLGLVSQFDAFLGKLLRVLALKKPHILVQSERQFSAKEVFEFSTIEEFRNQLIEKEIETVLRKSHAEQFTWIENKTGLKLRKNLSSWPNFIEIFERRNLLAHTNGRVSNTYLSKCTEAGCENLAEIGHSLDVSPQYLYESTQTLLEIGLKLLQVLMRSTENNEETDDSANDLLRDHTYELLYHEHLGVASSLLEFAFTPSVKHHDQRCEYVLIINRAIVFKALGKTDEMLKVIAPLEKMPLTVEFTLCILAIKGDVDKLVEKISKLRSGEFPVEAFMEWPAFKEARVEPKFIAALQGYYGDDLVDQTSD